MNISGLILAGGAGRRAQGRDKGLLPWQGSTLAAQVAARLAPQVSQLLISCNRNREDYAAIATLAPMDLRTGYQGPLAGLEAAASSLLHPWLLIVPCDSPALPLDLAQQLAATLVANEDLDLAYARCPQRDHYLHALMRSSTLSTLPAYLDGGERAVKHWYRQLHTTAVDFADAGAFANHNEIADC